MHLQVRWVPVVSAVPTMLNAFQVGCIRICLSMATQLIQVSTAAAAAPYLQNTC